MLEILDRIDVVVRRRRDQPHPGGRAADPRDVVVDLVSRELPALAGLGPLRHLDLDLVGVDEVVDGDAEAARRDLLDRRAAIVEEAVRVLAALARIRLRAEAVHRLGERLVGLARERAEAHRAGREALDDLGRRLDLLQRQRPVDCAQLHQAAQRRLPRRILVDHACEVLVGGDGVAVLTADRVLDLGDRVRVPDVHLAVATPLQDAADGEDFAVDARVGAEVALERLGREHVHPDPADARGGAGEVRGDQPRLEPDRLEDLRAAI